MNSKERVMAVLDHKEPDRVPIFELMIDPKVIEGILPKGNYLDLVDALDIDVVVTPTPSRMYSLEQVGEKDGHPIVQTEWGEKRINTGDMVTIPFEHPLKNHADWESYHVPDPDKPGRLSALRTYIERFKGRRMIACHLHDSFNYPSYLFGMEQLFLNMIMDPGWVKEVITACNNHCVRMVELAVKAGADAIVFGDDVGGKVGPLMSPVHYREFFLPGLAAVAQKAKELGAKVFKHTDGNVTSLLEMFIDAGVEAFHPSDPSSGMDIVEVKKKYGSRLVIMGGMDTGDPLCHWLVPKIVDEVKKRIDELAPGGGWMIASSNSIHSSVRPENYHAMVMATRTYGWYGSLGMAIDPKLEASIGKIPITPKK
jgi:uroporphyrinogen decarboxylase